MISRGMLPDELTATLQKPVRHQKFIQLELQYSTVQAAFLRLLNIRLDINDVTERYSIGCDTPVFYAFITMLPESVLPVRKMTVIWVVDK